MRIKNNFLKQLSITLWAFLLTIAPLQAFANTPNNLNVYDFSNDITIVEKNITNKDAEFLKTRERLIKKVGFKNAYALLGYIPVEQKIIDIEVPSASQSVQTLYATRSTPTTVSKSKNVSKGTMKVTMYKNPQSNYMDIWGEMTFSSGNKAGLIAFDDLFALNFDDTQVAKVSTSRTPSIINYNSSNSGGGEGRIQDGSTYARIVFTVKPNIISKNITECHGDTILLYGEKNVALPDNVSISVSGGSLSVSSGGHYSLNYLQYTGW